MVMKEKMDDGSTRLISGLTLAEITAAVLLAAYPVGAIYLTVNPANPSTIFGGTWVAWGTGQVPVGVDTGNVSFDTVEETGGSLTHTHDLDTASSGAQLRVGADTAMQSNSKNVASRTLTRQTVVASPTTVSSVSTSSVGLEGTSTATSTLQPYITCYMWKRTA